MLLLKQYLVTVLAFFFVSFPNTKKGYIVKRLVSFWKMIGPNITAEVVIQKTNKQTNKNKNKQKRPWSLDHNI